MRTPLDRPATPDVDVMLSVLCESRPPHPVDPATEAAAVCEVLSTYGIRAEPVSVKLAALNRDAMSRALGAGPADTSSAWVGNFSDVVVNVAGVLLAVNLERCRDEQAGFNPKAGFFTVPSLFWAGTAVVFLAGDDGSGMFMWTVPESSTEAVVAREVHREVARMAAAVAAVAHPGWVEVES